MLIRRNGQEYDVKKQVSGYGRENAPQVSNTIHSGACAFTMDLYCCITHLLAITAGELACLSMQAKVISVMKWKTYSKHKLGCLAALWNWALDVAVVHEGESSTWLSVLWRPRCFWGNEIFRGNEILFWGNEISFFTRFFFTCPFRGPVTLSKEILKKTFKHQLLHLKPLHTLGKVSVNASILYKNQEICNKTNLWRFQLVSLFLLWENSKNTFSVL